MALKTDQRSILSQIIEDMVNRQGGLLQCLICAQEVHRSGSEGKLEMLVDPAPAEETDGQVSRIELRSVASRGPRSNRFLFVYQSDSVLRLDLTALPSSSTTPFPSTPRPPHASSQLASLTNILPSLPDPLFLPPPFTPAHQHFQTLSALALARLESVRAGIDQEIAVFVAKKRADLAEAEKRVQREVSIVWDAYKSHATVSVPATPPAVSRRNSSTVEGVPRETGFSAGSRGSLNLERQAEAKSSSPDSILVSVPQVGTFNKVLTPTGSPPTSAGSLLGASLARSSHFPQHLRTSSGSSQTSSTPQVRSPLSPVPSQPTTPSASSSSTPAHSIPNKSNGKASTQDLDLATSMRFSHLPSPPNLIFSTTNARSGATLVRDGDDVKSKSWEERAALLGHQPTVMTPPVEDAEGTVAGEGGEQDVAFRESPERVAGPSTEREKEGKKEGGTPKRVTFKDENLPEDNDDDEEEGTVVGEQEDVFDFEPHSTSSQPSSTTSPPSSPTLTDSAPLLRATARSLERTSLQENAGQSLEPLYTLDGRSINPVSPSSTSPFRTFSADHPRGIDQTIDDSADSENKYLVSMRRLTAADLPSHRASYKDLGGVRKWAMYGRVSNSRSPSSSRDPEGGLPLVIPHSASLPVADLPRVAQKWRTKAVNPYPSPWLSLPARHCCPTLSNLLNARRPSPTDKCTSLPSDRPCARPDRPSRPPCTTSPLLRTPPTLRPVRRTPTAKRRVRRSTPDL